MENVSTIHPRMEEADSKPKYVVSTPPLIGANNSPKNDPALNNADAIFAH